MDTPVHNLREHWESAVNHTRARSPASFDPWFSSIQLDGIDAQRLALRGRDLFVRDWVSEHYLPSLLQYLRLATGISPQVTWAIGPIEYPVVPPVVDEPSSRPLRQAPGRPALQRPARSHAVPPPQLPFAAAPSPYAPPPQQAPYAPVMGAPGMGAQAHYPEDPYSTMGHAPHAGHASHAGLDAPGSYPPGMLPQSTTPMGMMGAGYGPPPSYPMQPQGYPVPPQAYPVQPQPEPIPPSHPAARAAAPRGRPHFGALNTPAQTATPAMPPAMVVQPPMAAPPMMAQPMMAAPPPSMPHPGHAASAASMMRPPVGRPQLGTPVSMVGNDPSPSNLPTPPIEVGASPYPSLAATAGRATIASGPASSPRPDVRSPAGSEGLNTKYTFENFIVGPSNELAYAAAYASAGGGGRRYSPLFLCGGTGLGKTHLLQAVGHNMLADQPGKRIIYVSAERFTNDFIAAIQNKRMDAFRAHYRGDCDLLLVDDIQFLAGREQTQEEFFHTFNALHELDRPIVFTSDKYPQQLERMEERLVSRFSWGLVADVQAPELETRVAIVRKKAQVEGIPLDDQVALFLAQTISSNVRELEGTLIRLAAKASLTNRPIDLAFAQGELTNVSGRGRVLSIDDIQRAVCSHFHLRPADLMSKDRHKTTAFARHIAMYLCKQKLPVSFPEVGRAFGKDHTTVMSAVRKVESLREQDAQVRAHLETIEKKLAG